MEQTLFDKDGNSVAYFANDYHHTIYLWNGIPTAYLYDEQHVYGINGKHLGWFIDEIIYDNDGNRIGFTTNTCPVAIARETVKSEKYPMDEIRSRWEAPPFPKLNFNFAELEFADFLKAGQVPRFLREETSPESTGQK
ncbi:MAG: hypothetical protein JW882_06990 [Deltaproteobacteria bacterium]|nr:hypothetical protein [Deltaproteobacteria bacterium]